MLLKAFNKVQHAFNTHLFEVLTSIGWRTEMIAYGGLGNGDQVRIIGRALAAPAYFEDKYNAWAKRHGLPNWYTMHSRAADRLPGPMNQMIHDAIGADLDDETETTGRMRGERGWRQFINAKVPNAPVLITVGKRKVLVHTDREGYIDLSVSGHGFAQGWHVATLQALKPDDVASGKTRVKATRPVYVPIRIVSEEEHYGLVSDVDDTVMVSWLPRPMVAAKNAFFMYVSQRQAVPGMAELLSEIATSRGFPDLNLQAPTVYLSTGAWNVAPGLRRFLWHGNFPTGTPLMTDWGPSQTGWFRSGREHKRTQLRWLARTFPWVKWVLVGDDGQHDPSLYTEFAREHPDNVAAIYLRSLTTAEQVLNHGAPDPLEELSPLLAKAPSSIPVFIGEDGFDLAQRAKNARNVT